MSLTIDTSVWVAAAESTDKFHAVSRQFTTQVLAKGVPVYVPAFARVEIACALSRRMRNPSTGQMAASFGLLALKAVEVPVDAALLDEACCNGCATFLRGADALFAATATLTGSTLISWDAEHLTRAQATTPADWLALQGVPPPAP
jgi:predicted nucleic acid-binding protein